MGETKVRATLLGTSGAWPIPRPGCACPQCAEARREPRLRRTRTGLRLEAGGEVLLVDAGPDLAAQLERESVGPRVDRLVVTHTHADHVLGLDDLVHLRAPREEPLVVHAAPWHQERIARVFPHLVRWGAEKVRFARWGDGERVEAEGLVLEGFETGHSAEFPTTGVLLRIATPAGERRVAFATDLGEPPESSRERLRGIDLLVGDGSFLGGPGHGHGGTDADAALARDLGIRGLLFTHVGHVRLADADLRARLAPAGLALDGDLL